MNILVYSSVFYPSIGGMETFAEDFCSELASQGYIVNLITYTPLLKDNNKTFNFTIYRKPEINIEIKLIRSANRIIHNCIWTPKSILSLLFNHNNYVIHHTWYGNIESSKSRIQDKVKMFLMKFYTNISISQAIANSLPVKSTIIHNFIKTTNLQDTLFEDQKIKNLVFLGRLVSDKGCLLLLEALKYLNDKNITPSLDIIGTGPEESTIKKYIKENNLSNQVKLLGAVSHDKVYQTLKKYQIIVVPSQWQEPFGLVAIEGILSGCIPIVSDTGGLPEAIGNCGLTFKNKDKIDLSIKIETLLNNKSLQNQYKKNFEVHLKKHSLSNIIIQYKDILNIN